MSFQDDIGRFQQKEDLIVQIKELCGGREPASLRETLRILTHPDLRGDVSDFFNGIGIQHTCLIYEAPWNCMRETDTRYENMRYGGVGGGSEDISARWCQPCRERGWLEYEE